MRTGAAMLDDAVRLSFLVLVGIGLALTVVWYVTFCWQQIRGTGQVVIDPLTVVDDAGKSDKEIGTALAQMLQARLESLTSELRDAQSGLTATATSSTAQASAVARVGDVRLWTQDVALHTGLLQPVEMKLSVGGVEVGGMLPWLQRRFSSRRTLHFTIYSHGDEAQVVGSVSALRLSGAGVRLVVKGTDGKPPSLNTVVDGLAHEIVRRWLAQDQSNRVELLRPAEFVELATVVVSAADSNRRSIRGRPAQNEFAALLPRVTALSDEVPDWPELGYFAAWIADKARDPATAVTYYRRVLLKLDGSKQKALVALINDRLSTLTPPTAERAVAEKRAEVAPVKPAIDFASQIKIVRDSGNEGSVVGQALATALEFQIAKALNENVRISARYIYYVARQAAGTTETDSGAQIKDAVRALSRRGAVEESVWPYVAGEFAAKPPAAVDKARRFRIADARLLGSLDDVKRALAQNGPVVAGIAVFQSAMGAATTKTGVFPLPKDKEQIIGGHAIVIVGYDDQDRRVKFVNSWGAGWGDHGFGYVPYDYLAKYMSDAWTFRLAPSTVARKGEHGDTT